MGNKTDTDQIGDATLPRKVSRPAILELIQENGRIARSDAARRLELRLPMITRSLSWLIKGHLNQHAWLRRFERGTPLDLARL